MEDGTIGKVGKVGQTGSKWRIGKEGQKNWQVENDGRIEETDRKIKKDGIWI